MNAPVGAGEHRIRLTLHYDGGGFAGWQFQPGERTVQGELETALSRLLGGRTARVTAAGRTDRGVHATGQVAGVVVPAKWSASELRRALNAVLPNDIWIADAGEAGNAFHARYDAVARGYVYRLGTTDVSRSPFLRRWCWPLGEPVPLDALNEAAAAVVGDHSFRAFAKAGQPERGERCIVLRSMWRDWAPGGIAFHVVANRFLHHMVRYLVGTMVDVARGRRPPGDMAALLDGEPGMETSPPAPPEGLFLTRVYYAGDDTNTEEPADEILSGQR